MQTIEQIIDRYTLEPPRECEEFDNEYFTITMPDGSIWGMPVIPVMMWCAEDIAERHSDEYDNAHTALIEEVIPIYKKEREDKGFITLIDELKNNSYFSDWEKIITQFKAPRGFDFEDGWVNGPWRLGWKE